MWRTLLLATLSGCSWISAEDFTAQLDRDGDGVDGLTDCNDQDPELWAARAYFTDADGDGFGDDNGLVEACQTTPPEGTVATAGDCDDDDERVHPDAVERCNGVDDDCDGASDDDDPDLDADTAEVWLPDADGDGFPSGADLEAAVRACDAPPGFATPLGSLDCDDTAAGVHPAATEVCGDGIDNDCDGRTDDQGQQELEWFLDADGDQWPDDWEPIVACGDDDGARMSASDAPSGTTAPDCDPGDASIYPGAPDAWYDGVDSNCDGADDFDQDLDGVRAVEGGGTDCDDTDASVAPGLADAWYDGIDTDCDGADDFDQDGDGHRDPSGGGDDCDDDDADAHPDAIELPYDGIDSDCDGADDFDQDGDGVRHASGGGDDCDDLDPTVHPGAVDTWYDGADSDCAGNDDFDQDGDGVSAVGFGGYDCLDTDPSVRPGAADAWYDGVDSDCAGNDDFDQDGDGDPTAAGGGGDCDDLDPARFSTAIDPWYDGIDTNCDGADDFDQDGDGHRDASGGGDDCDDTDASVFPAAPDTWYDGLDSDCAGDDDFDVDGDGHRHPDGGGLDCNDLVATVHPGAPDAWYDGIDADCAGNDDYDADDDGRTPSFAPTGSRDDCDDGDPDVRPGGLEIVDDGIDQDCSGADTVSCFTDADGDGVGSIGVTSPEGGCGDGLASIDGDCDDSDRFTYPGAPELCDDLDQDCNGIAEGDVVSVDLRDGRRQRVLDGATIDSDTIERVDVCGGVWDLQLSWDPSDGDLTLQAHPSYDRPILDGARAIVIGAGAGRTDLHIEGFDVLHQAPGIELVQVDGTAGQRPSVTLSDVRFTAVDVDAVVEVTYADLVLDRVGITDSQVDDHAVSIESGSALIVDSYVLDTNRVPEYTSSERGVLYGEDAYVELVRTELSRLFGHAATFRDATVELLETTWADNLHSSASSSSGSNYDPAGAGIWMTGGSLTDVGSTFSGHGIRFSEGAALDLYDVNLSLTDTVFSDNGAPLPASIDPGEGQVYRGAAIDVGAGDVELVGVQFLDNVSESGAADVSGSTIGQLTMIDVVVDGASGGDSFGSGSIGLYSVGDLVVDGLTVSNVGDEDDVWVLITGPDEAVLEDLDFVDAPVDALRLEFIDELTLSHSTFDGSGGHGLYLEAVGQAHLHDNVFTGNDASSGGAIFLDETTLYSERNTFSGNTASFAGGALYVSADSALHSCGDTFDGNHSTGSGGGIYAYDGTVALGSGRDGPCVDTTVLVDNTAELGGGVAMEHHGSLTLHRTRFEANDADDGGGLFVSGALAVDDDVSFVANTAERGGGAYAYTEWLAQEWGSARFEGNDADEGGGLFVDGEGWDLAAPPPPSFDGTTFEGNTAATGGAALHVDPLTGSFEDFFLFDLYGPPDLDEWIRGSIVLADNGDPSVVRAGTGDWLVDIDATGGQVVDDAGLSCSLPEGPSTLECASGAPCVCP